MNKLTIIAISLLALICACAPKMQPSYEEIAAENQQLKEDNALLVKILEEKLISLCDTMTLAEKIAWQKLDGYSDTLLSERLASDLWSYEAKLNAEMTAFKQKTKLGLVAFEDYRAKSYRNLKAWMTADPTSFKDYALINLIKENASGEDEEIYWNRAYELEHSNSSAKKYFTADSLLWEAKEKAETAIEAAYDSTLKDLEYDYEARLKEAEKIFQEKLAIKKAELGLK